MDPNQADPGLIDVRFGGSDERGMPIGEPVGSMYPQWNPSDGMDGGGMFPTNTNIANPLVLAVRKGKWSEEEEILTKKLISAFYDGYLQIPVGTTLRSFLSEMLFCNPMRITKKFAGSACIGKQSFTPCESTPENNAKVKEIQAELYKMHNAFIKKLMGEQYSTVGMGGAFTSAAASYTGAGYNVMPSFEEKGLVPNLNGLEATKMSGNSASPRSTTSRGSIAEEEYAKSQQAHSLSIAERAPINTGLSGDSNQEYLMQQYKQQVFLQQQYMQQQHHQMLLMMAQQQQKLQNGGSQDDSEIDTNAVAKLAQLNETTNVNMNGRDDRRMVPLKDHPSLRGSSSSSGSSSNNTTTDTVPHAASSLSVVDGNSSGSDNPSSRASGSGGTGSGEDAKSNDSGVNSKSLRGTSTTSSSDGHTTMSTKSRSMAHGSIHSNAGEKDISVGSGTLSKRMRTDKTVMDRARSPSSSDDSNTHSGSGGDGHAIRDNRSGDPNGMKGNKEEEQEPGVQKATSTSSLEQNAHTLWKKGIVVDESYAHSQRQVRHLSPSETCATAVPNIALVLNGHSGRTSSKEVANMEYISDRYQWDHKRPVKSNSPQDEIIYPWNVTQAYPYTKDMTHETRAMSGKGNAGLDMEVDVDFDGTNALTKKNMRKKRNIDDALASGGVMGYPNTSGSDLGANAIARFNSQGDTSKSYYLHSQAPVQGGADNSGAMAVANAQISQRFSFQYPGLPHVFATGYGSSSTIQTLPHAKSISDLAMDYYDGLLPGGGGPTRVRAGSYNPTTSYMLSRKAGAMELAKAESEQVATNSPMNYGGRDEHAQVFSRAQARNMMEAGGNKHEGNKAIADQEASDLLMNFFKKATGPSGLPPGAKIPPVIATQLAAQQRKRETVDLPLHENASASSVSHSRSSSSVTAGETLGTMASDPNSMQPKTLSNTKQKNGVILEKVADRNFHSGRSSWNDNDGATGENAHIPRAARKSLRNTRGRVALNSVPDGIPRSAIDVVSNNLQGAVAASASKAYLTVKTNERAEVQMSQGNEIAARRPKATRDGRRTKAIVTTGGRYTAAGEIGAEPIRNDSSKEATEEVTSVPPPEAARAKVPVPVTLEHGYSDYAPSSSSLSNHGVEEVTSSYLSADDEGPHVGRSDSTDSLSSNSFEATKTHSARIGNKIFGGSVSSRENGDELNEDSAKSDDLSSERSDEDKDGAKIARHSLS